MSTEKGISLFAKLMEEANEIESSGNFIEVPRADERGYTPIGTLTPHLKAVYTMWRKRQGACHEEETRIRGLVDAGHPIGDGEEKIRDLHAKHKNMETCFWLSLRHEFPECKTDGKYTRILIGKNWRILGMTKETAEIMWRERVGSSLDLPPGLASIELHIIEVGLPRG